MPESIELEFLNGLLVLSAVTITYITYHYLNRHLEGAGSLSLSIVRAIAEADGGRVKLTGQSGNRFYLHTHFASKTTEGEGFA